MISILENIINEFENKKFIEKNNNRNRGVIYTPQPIADFMVTNIFRIFFDEFPEIQKIFQKNCDYISLKQLFAKNNNLKDRFEIKIRNIKILDPACGTGRYLIAIAKFLFNIYQALELEYTDYSIKKKIIQNHLYGIEIDESASIISKIRLISWIYSDNDTPFLDESIDINSDLGEIEVFVNRFKLNFNIFNQDYLLEFDSTDIDIIIGNPPYVENKKILDLEFKKKIKKKFESAYGLYDLSIIFIEKSIELLKIGVGCLSFLTTNKFLSADYGLKIREMLLRDTELKEIINVSSLPIFQKTAAYPIIISFKKRTTTSNTILIKKFESIKDFKNFQNEKMIELPQDSIKNLPSSVIPISPDINLVNFLYTNFKPMIQVIKGLKIIYRPFGFIKWAEHFKNISKNKTSNKDLILIGTGNVGKYYIDFKKRIKIAKENHEISYFSFPSEQKEVWDNLNSEKIIFREIAKDITCVYDPGIYVNLTGLYFLRVPSFKTNDYFCLLSIMNSDIINLVFKALYGTLHMSGGYLRYNGSFIKKLPMPESFPTSLSYLGKIIQFL
ncbi:MAG: Eco57I restriction-modification methylase domain-containing protein, partial [Candidatus Lokiarchaeota archaeon]|nr:Eco57I restriction-modification methylase domain-containing protein [Candidatus Lokiarchaeota archaeon]